MNKKPNFLVIMSDQHAPGALGFLGHPVLTPNLDRLAARGTTFTNAYCPYPMCTPSRASFMTGLRTPEHQVWELGTPLGTGIPTWAHLLNGAGYITSISGRMHFIGPDKTHGFLRRVHPDIKAMMVPHTYGDWDHPQGDEHVMLRALRESGSTEAHTEAETFDREVTTAAIEELRYLSESGKPWALTVGYYLPHFPYQVSKEYFDLYRDDDIPRPRPAPETPGREGWIPPQTRESRKWLGLTEDGISPQEVVRTRRAYYGMVSHLDALIGRLLDALEAHGEAENTYILYLSDHGDNLGEHGFWSKLNFFEESVRTPFIIAPPRPENPGSRCRALISNIDWMTTLKEFAPPSTYYRHLPGRSLFPLLRDPGERWAERTIVSDYACDGTRVPMRMVRQGRWKACFAPGFPPVLYDLSKDPGEWNDLAPGGEHAGTIEKLKQAALERGWQPEELTEQIIRQKRGQKLVRGFTQKT